MYNPVELNFFVNPSATLTSSRLGVDFSKKHYEEHANGRKVCEKKMGYRDFDFFVILAFVKIWSSYVANWLPKKKRPPYYNFTVGDVEVGKYVTSSVQSEDIEAVKNPLIFFFKFHITLMRAAFVFGAALRNKDKVDALFLGDTPYLDGIWIDFFLQKPKTVVYLDLDPFGTLSVHQTFRNQSELHQFLLKENQGRAVFNQTEIAKYMKFRLSDPDSAISYYSSSLSVGAPPKVSKTKMSVIVYVHSFTDAQMFLGYDGFKNVYEWLRFTLRVLSKLGDRIDVYVKAHPVFFAESNVRISRDRQLWQDAVKEMPQSINVVSDSRSNALFLSSFDNSRAVLLTHHGNAIPEGAFLGFSSISSSKSTWSSDYNFSRTWSDRSEYRKLLMEILGISGLDAKATLSIERYVSHFYMKAIRIMEHDWKQRLILQETGKFSNVPLSEVWNLYANLDPQERLRVKNLGALRIRTI